MNERKPAYLEQHVQNIEDVIGNLDVSQITFNIFAGSTGTASVHVEAKDNKGRILFESYDSRTFSEALKELDNNIWESVQP